MVWRWPTGGLEARLDRLPDRNQRLAKRLRHEQPHLFRFLRCPGLDATNNFAERAIRLMAMACKRVAIERPTVPGHSRFSVASCAPAGSKPKTPSINRSSWLVRRVRFCSRSSLPNPRLDLRTFGLLHQLRPMTHGTSKNSPERNLQTNADVCPAGWQTYSPTLIVSGLAVTPDCL